MELATIISILSLAVTVILALSAVGVGAFVLYENIRIKSDIVQLTQSLTGTVNNVDVLIKSAQEFENKRQGIESRIGNAEFDVSQLRDNISAISKQIDSQSNFNGDVSKIIQRLASGEASRTIEGEATQA